MTSVFAAMRDALVRHAAPPQPPRPKRKVNPDKRNGPAPVHFKTCAKCGETKARRQNFRTSRHYADWYDIICLACRACKS